MSDEPHNCFDHLIWRGHSWRETHGLDTPPYEDHFQEWWQCSVCGVMYSLEEAAAEIAEAEQAAAGDEP